MNEPKTNTIFHGNCEPEVTHHSEGGYTITFFKPDKIGEAKGKAVNCELEQVQMKAFTQLCNDALAHQHTISTHEREENDGRKPE